MKTLIAPALIAMLGSALPGCVNVAVLASIPDDAANESSDATEPHDVAEDHEGNEMDGSSGPRDDDRSGSDH